VAREAVNARGELLQVCPLTNEEEIIDARAVVKMHAKDLGFSVLNQTKIVTAVSELARNVVEHGLGGTMRIESVENLETNGLRMTFKDEGPGIADIDMAMTDGYTSQKGMGLGLTGSKRLMDQFKLESTPGEGTTVVITKWK
jgi:serine/threonine-protein kinase RsbT